MPILNRLFNNQYADRLRGLVTNWPEAYVSFTSIVRFIALKPAGKTVIFVEPNAFHGEVIPGFYKYFNDLGYSVIVFCRQANQQDNPFCRCTNKPRIFAFDPLPMRWVLMLDKVSAFDLMFLTSKKMFDPYVHIWGDYIGTLPDKPKSKYGVMSVEHDPKPEERPEDQHLHDTFVLTKQTLNQAELPMLNPHWFGEIKITPLNEGKRVFILVGGGTIYENSIALLIKAAKELQDQYDFEIWLVGKGLGSTFEGALPACIRVFGRVRFEKLYELMERSDFILPMLDPNNPDHQTYLNGVTSGSRQLVLGFSKVAVIHRQFAQRYDFSEGNTLVYDDDSFLSVLEKALTISMAEYSALQKSLQKLSRDVYKESFNNLKSRINDQYAKANNK